MQDMRSATKIESNFITAMKQFLKNSVKSNLNLNYHHPLLDMFKSQRLTK